MLRKLGLTGMRATIVDDDRLLTDLGELLVATEIDYTLFFRRLARPSPSFATIADAYYGDVSTLDRAAVSAWLARYAARVALEAIDDRERTARIEAVNPLYVPRNYLVQEVIEATDRGDRTQLLELLDVLRRPYTEQPGRERYASKRPEWARHKPGCSMLSCSS